MEDEKFPIIRSYESKFLIHKAIEEISKKRLSNKERIRLIEIMVKMHRLFFSF